MKLMRICCLFIAALLMNIVSAQLSSIDIDNQSPCDYRVSLTQRSGCNGNSFLRAHIFNLPSNSFYSYTPPAGMIISQVKVNRIDNGVNVGLAADYSCDGDWDWSYSATDANWSCLPSPGSGIWLNLSNGGESVVIVPNIVTGAPPGW